MRRFASLDSDGVRAERILVACRTRAGAATLRDRIEAVLAHAHEEPWIGTHAEIAERILREHPTEAGLDPFFTTVTAADRLAILLDRVDDLPLRRHEIRGNPAGLLARLLRRIDLLKLECVTPGPPARLGDSARPRGQAARAARAGSPGDRVRRALRAPRQDGLRGGKPRRGRSSDRGGAPGQRIAPTSRKSSRTAFQHVMVDELEDAAPAHMRFIAGIASPERACLVATHDSEAAIRRFRGASEGSLEWFRATYPAAEEVELQGRHRFGPVVGAAVEALLGEEPDVPTARWRGALLALRGRARAGPGRGPGDRGAPVGGRDAARAHLRGRRRRMAPGPAGGGRARGAERPVPGRGRRFVLRQAGGSRRARLAADARRSLRRRSGRPRPDAPARGPALGRPGPRDHHRPAAKARHGLRPGRRAGEPAAPPRGPRPDPGVPEAPEVRRGRDGGDAPGRLRPPPDRAGGHAPAPALRRDAGDGGAAGEPLAAGRARRRLVAPGAARLRPRLRPPHRRRRRGRRGRRRGGRSAALRAPCCWPSPRR